MDYIAESEKASRRAAEVLEKSGVERIWRDAGARVSRVGSLRMGLLARHRDIDLHVYSRNITEDSSFAVAARMAADPAVVEIRCINGLHTDEHCIAWHLSYSMDQDEIWQIDIIHIEAGTEYDGYFEKMADRIRTIMTPEQRELILKLKFDTPDSEDIHGVEYYEAVLADGITTLDGLRQWLTVRRSKGFYYWMPSSASSR